MEGSILCFCFSIYIFALLVVVDYLKPGSGMATKARKPWYEEQRDGERLGVTDRQGDKLWYDKQER